MELEFDKEIDAILRKAHGGAATTVTDGHLDADTIAAFAENAMPERAKLLYTEHFADCDRCRKQLSQSIRANRGADATAASIVSAPVEAITSPWYAKLFRNPNLAIAMGSLVLVFSGVLGFLVVQRQNQTAANNAVISQATEPDAAHGPYYAESGSANANTAPEVSSSTNAAQANAGVVAPGSASNTASAVGRVTTSEEKADDDKAFALDGATGGAAEAKPALPAAAPPRPADEPKTERENSFKLGEDEIAKEKDLARAEKRDDTGARSRMDRDAVPQSLKNAGPTRSGPMQKQSNQVNTGAFDMSVTRSVGGKTFFNRNGAWVDTTYSGRSPIMVRRGSDAFKKLDSGLRNIANELYGVVVVAWKGKAYRIQ